MEAKANEIKIIVTLDRENDKKQVNLNSPQPVTALEWAVKD